MLKALANRQAAAGQSEEAADSLARARDLTEALLDKSPTDDALAGFLADLMLADTTRWTVLEPIDPTSAGDATLTTLADNSVLAGGLNPDHDKYTVSAETNLQNITAIRLEALTDDSLPGHGPGRFSGGPRGVFVMDGIHVTAASEQNPDASVDVNLDAASADYFFPGRPITPDGEWHAGGGAGTGRPNVAIYRLAEPVGGPAGSRLTFHMNFNHGPQWHGLQLGRFRISVTDDPTAFDTHDRRFVVSRLKDPWARLGAASVVVGGSDLPAERFARALERTPRFAARLELVERIEDLQTDLNDLLTLRPDDPLLWGALARRQAGGGQAVEAAESLARARSLTEALLDGTADWTVVNPDSMTLEGDATFTPLADGSILAGGPLVSGDVYTIRAPVGVSLIRAIRLEAIPDPSLPGQGPGRHSSGNFQLQEFRVFATTGANGEPARSASHRRRLGQLRVHRQKRRRSGND